jgi:hypothetical protein
MEEILVRHAMRGNAEAVQKLLKDQPDTDVNLVRPGRSRTALSMACTKGNLEVVRVLLAHPGSDPNIARVLNPIVLAWMADHRDIVKLMLSHPAVDINCGLLWRACRQGDEETVVWLLGSNKTVDARSVLTGPLLDAGHTPAEIACHHGFPHIAKLIEAYNSEPLAVRHKIQLTLDVLEAKVAAVFALVVFLCDGLLAPRLPDLNTGTPPGAPETDTKAARFFSVAQRLPLELQMVLCNRMHGSSKNTVRREHSEPAFRALFSPFVFNIPFA